MNEYSAFIIVLFGVMCFLIVVGALLELTMMFLL